MLFSKSRPILWCVAVLMFVTVMARCHGEESRELYRIRFINRANGAIEVSDDQGRTYQRVGKITRPATSTQRGFSASVYSEPGKVVATAVHGIRIKTGGARDCHKDASQTISIIPAEFTHTPNGFGGYVAGTSGIYTDVPTGKAIFRNLAPLAGNTVYRQVGQDLVPIHDGYYPRDGDVLIIAVTIPVRYPKEIVLENKPDGLVRMVYADGEGTVAKILRPVRGTGRFDATGYTGVGRINTNHTGVITVSTAPIANGEKDGSASETRGGFMIQPSRHAESALETDQIMVVGPMAEGAGWLEGRPPLFSGLLGLAYDPSSEANSFGVDIKTKSGWSPMPKIVGLQKDALAHLPNGGGSVSAIRIRFPEFNRDWIHTQLQQSAKDYLARAKARSVKTGVPVITDDSLTLKVDASKLQDLSFVNFYLDGQLRGSSNTPPYSFTLDTRSLSPGEHVAVIRAIGASGMTVKEVSQAFFLQEAGLPSR